MFHHLASGSTLRADPACSSSLRSQLLLCPQSLATTSPPTPPGNPIPCKEHLLPECSLISFFFCDHSRLLLGGTVPTVKFLASVQPHCQPRGTCVLHSASVSRGTRGPHWHLSAVAPWLSQILSKVQEECPKSFLRCSCHRTSLQSLLHV